jgi:hypothetical protein
MKPAPCSDRAVKDFAQQEFCVRADRKRPLEGSTRTLSNLWFTSVASVSRCRVETLRPATPDQDSCAYSLPTASIYDRPCSHPLTIEPHGSIDTRLLIHPDGVQSS